MEDNQGQPQVTHSTSDSSDINFPTVGEPTKKGGGAKTILVIGIIVLVGILGYLIFKNVGSKNEVDEDLTPSVTEVENEDNPTPVPTVAPTEKPENKSDIKIEIQNGTGITGEAAYLQTELKKLNYTSISVGNASSQDQSDTAVTYSKKLSSSLQDEMTEKLKTLYKEVKVKTSSSTSIDIVIVTGLRKGATSKPSATSTPKTSPTASAKPSVTPTSTP